jgi:hypothetical protein
MGRIGSLFAPSQLPYPTGSATQGPSEGAPHVAQHPAGGFFNKLFAPKELPYPLPSATSAPQSSSSTQSNAPSQNAQTSSQPAQPTSTAQASQSNSSAASQPAQSTQSSAPAANDPPTSQAPVSSAPVEAPAASSAPTASAPLQNASPITVVLAPWPVACGAQPSTQPPAAQVPTGAPASTDSVPSSAPASVPTSNNVPSAPTVSTPPVDKVVTLYATNPRLRARHPRAQEIYLEEVLDEKITVRMLTKDGEPIAFTVPDGCNAVDFFVGSVELNPGVGRCEDTEEILILGNLVINGGDAPTEIDPGDVISVVLPWRYASWVELAADHLRAPIHARFYSNGNA